MTCSSPLSENIPIHSSPPPKVAPVLDLNSLPPIFVLPTHLAVDDLHQLEDRLTDYGGQVTYNIDEARLVIGKVGTKRRALMELRARRLFTDEVTPETSAKPVPFEPPKKRRKVEGAENEVIEILDESTTDDDSGEQPQSTLSASELQGDTVKVIKMEWLDDSSEAGTLLSLRSYLVYEGKPTPETQSPSTPISSQRIQSPVIQRPRLSSGKGILERAKADAYPGAPSSQLKSSPSHYAPANRGPRRFRDHSHNTSSKTTLLQQTTSDYEGEPSSDMPPAPDWVTRGIKYACQRSTPAESPNAAFISQLKAIRKTRTLTGDEVGVRAYSTSIAALAAYPYHLTQPKEILRLPGCGAKIANLWIEWKNRDEGAVAAVSDADNDETLQILRTFYDIWGVGATTAREFLFEKGWRDLDDVVDHGWSALTRVQQIGVKYYEEFQRGIPRPEVERIASVVCDHAIRVRDEGVEVVLVGGYRRGKEAPGDVDLIVSHRDLDATENLVTDLVASLETEGWITHTLLLSLHNSQRGQSVLPYKAAATAIGPKSVGFDTLDKALVVWQDPEWLGKQEGDVEKDPKKNDKKNPKLHRRVDIIISPWRTLGCAIAGWSGGTTFQRDLRRYAKNVKGWKFDSSGVRDRTTGEVVPLEGPEGVGEGLGWENAEKKVFEGMGLPWFRPEERCTG
ncbi:BRCT domain-containing protein [Botryosphaeria dothidea]|uniref:DNA polymerase n=1 Tax=Botryosphaeria dothidea TaxID=55169 RepID=A0A8H4J5V5_9PEZI|nr:BRCT domain-containing protein [Botryosphaeria dothidea]